MAKIKHPLSAAAKHIQKTSNLRLQSKVPTEKWVTSMLFENWKQAAFSVVNDPMLQIPIDDREVLKNVFIQTMRELDESFGRIQEINISSIKHLVKNAMDYVGQFFSPVLPAQIDLILRTNHRMRVADEEKMKNDIKNLVEKILYPPKDNTSFIDFLAQEHKIKLPVLIEIYKNCKPKRIAMMLLASEDLGLLEKGVTGYNEVNQIKFHEALRKDFGNIGSRQGLFNIIKRLRRRGTDTMDEDELRSEKRIISSAIEGS